MASLRNPVGLPAGSRGPKVAVAIVLSSCRFALGRRLRDGFGDPAAAGLVAVSDLLGFQAAQEVTVSVLVAEAGRERDPVGGARLGGDGGYPVVAECPGGGGHLGVAEDQDIDGLVGGARDRDGATPGSTGESARAAAVWANRVGGEREGRAADENALCPAQTCGGPRRARTDDRRIKSPMLYPLS